ncbi:MAG: hypothetical protein ACE5FY_03430 [Nitrospiria bacterium]
MNIVVSLMAEARPLIDLLRLHRLAGKHPFLIYTNEDFNLIISGIGKLFSAAATAYLQALTRKEGPVAWFNFGIAGHRDLEIGQGFIAHKVTDQATQRCYYPPLIYPLPCATSDLTTVDTPNKEYKTSGGYDMEASGYYQMALRSTTIEWVQCYKVVSDIPQYPVEKITKASVIRLMDEHLDEIEIILSTLIDAINRHATALIQDMALSTEFDIITQQWHFTETQKSQLSKLLQRWLTLHGKYFPAQLAREAQNAESSVTSAKAFLADIEQKLSNHLITF